MAHWQKKEPEFSEMNQAVVKRPGITAAALARQLAVDRSTVLRRLPSMAEAGYLLYEDDEGKLYPFDPNAL